MTDAGSLRPKLAALAALGFQRAEDPEVHHEAVGVSRGRVRITSTRPSMGTLVSVTAVDSSRDRIQEAAGRAFQEMDRVVGLLNRYDSASAVGYLNAEGEILGPPPELCRVLSRALAHHQYSAGAFDPTVQPLVDLFRARSGRSIGSATPASSGPAPPAPPGPGSPEPTETAIRDALSRIDASAVELASRSIRFNRPGMGITLDGIAKGYVVDGMTAILEAHGLENFLVDAGGDIRSLGFREDGQPWQVGVQDPDKNARLPDVIPLRGMAVATSGSYEIHFDPEQVRHHIVAPGKGASPGHSRSVSVVAPSALEADALATSVFVMTPEQGLAFIETITNCACLLVDREGREHRSSRWRRVSPSIHPKAGNP